MCKAENNQALLFLTYSFIVIICMKFTLMCILFTESRPPCLAVLMGVLSRVDSFGVHQSSKSKWAVCAPSESTLVFPRVPRVEFKVYLFYPYGRSKLRRRRSKLQSVYRCFLTKNMNRINRYGHPK